MQSSLAGAIFARGKLHNKALQDARGASLRTASGECRRTWREGIFFKQWGNMGSVYARSVAYSGVLASREQKHYCVFWFKG